MFARTWNSRLSLAALPLFLFACGGEDVPEPDAAPAPVAEEAAPAAEPATEHVTIALASSNESGVFGEAMAMHTDESVVVVLEIAGLPAAGEYAAHVHIGTCATGGGVAAALNPVIGLADGTGSSTTTLELSALPAEQSHFVQVHGAGGSPVACGDMEGREG